MLARLVMASRGADAAPPGEMLASCHRMLAAGVRVFDALVLRGNLRPWLPGWWELFELNDRLVREVTLRAGGAQRVDWADFTPISPGWPEIQ
jgi:hypothetical protein